MLKDKTGNEIAGNTRQFKTHAEWCRWLSVRGHLDTAHQACLRTDSCVVPRSHYSADKSKPKERKKSANSNT